MTQKLSLNGQWMVDYYSDQPYTSEQEPEFIPAIKASYGNYITPCPVPAYWEDLMELFRSTPLHTKLRYNPLYTLQRYPQAGYVPDMALPNPVGCMIYRKTFTAKADYTAETELYFGGVQNTVSVWINGQYLGKHEGYSVEFFVPVPAGVIKKGENTVTLAVSNLRLKGYMDRPVSGLTSRAANECTGGIYGDVELRTYPDGLKDLWITTARDCASFTVHTECKTAKTLQLFDGQKLVYTAELPAGQNEFELSSEGYQLWTPAAPKLYTAVITTANQRLERRFGIRRLTVEGTKLYLNGEPYFFRGTCEHCYQPITVHPTRDKNYYRKVIRTLKELGFNSIRFHTWVPMQEYMDAADELGMIFEIETPNNTAYAEWREIVRCCRHYSSPVLYSSGNEMLIDEDYIEHLRACAELVHTETDSLFSPISALRGIEYHQIGDDIVKEPFPHNAKRLKAVGEFCDVYNSYSHGFTSYSSVSGTPEKLDLDNSIYGKPLLTHEACIQGTYCDLSLKDRYRGTRIGDTEFISSIEKHLEERGLLERAPLYYRNSAAWQRILRKHCFETIRRCESFAGYDFLGDIDTHWHTFGYCVGMMNEFYELKPGETVQNVLRYNSDAVLLADLPECLSYECGARAEIPLHLSNYGKSLDKATLLLRVTCGGKVLLRKTVHTNALPAGEITGLYTLSFRMPYVEKPQTVKLSATLFGDDTDCENEWELYLFPKFSFKRPSAAELRKADVIVTEQIDEAALQEALAAGKRVVLFGNGPFATVDAKFQLSVAGRTHGHLATVIEDHPLMEDFPHEGFCSWPFRKMMESTHAALLELPRLPHAPIIDIASTYKNVHREAFLFEYSVGKGKLVACTFTFEEDDPAARWLKAKMISYAMSEEFSPRDAITPAELSALCRLPSIDAVGNVNEAQNANDITMTK